MLYLHIDDNNHIFTYQIPYPDKEEVEQGHNYVYDTWKDRQPDPNREDFPL